MRRLRLAALSAMGQLEPASCLRMLDCYGADTSEWLTDHRPRQCHQRACTFQEAEWSSNDLRLAAAACMRNPIYQRVLARERTYPDEGLLAVGATSPDTHVRLHNRRLLAEALNRRHAWLQRRRHTRSSFTPVPEIAPSRRLAASRPTPFPAPCLLPHLLHYLSPARRAAAPASRTLGRARRQARRGACARVPWRVRAFLRPPPGPLPAGTSSCMLASGGMRTARAAAAAAAAAARTTNWKRPCAASLPATCRCVRTCG